MHAVTVLSATPVVTTAETAAATSTAFSVNDPGGQGVRVSGAVNVTTGVGCTGLTIRVCRGGAAGGPLVGNALPVTIGASASVSVPFDVVDPQLQAQAQQYTVTVQQAGATGNATVNQATICCEAATAVE